MKITIDVATIDQITNSLDDLKKAFYVSNELDDFFNLQDTSETDEKRILYERERVEVFYNIVMDYLHSAYNSIDNAAIDLMAASKVRETKE